MQNPFPLMLSPLPQRIRLFVDEEGRYPSCIKRPRLNLHLQRNYLIHVLKQENTRQLHQKNHLEVSKWKADLDLSPINKGQQYRNHNYQNGVRLQVIASFCEGINREYSTFKSISLNVWHVDLTQWWRPCIYSMQSFHIHWYNSSHWARLINPIL